MAAYLCAPCKTPWPHVMPYGRCPSCSGPCTYSSLEPIEYGDVQWAVDHLNFERYYAEREAKRLAAEIEAHGVTSAVDPSPKQPPAPWRTFHRD